MTNRVLTCTVPRLTGSESERSVAVVVKDEDADLMSVPSGDEFRYLSV